MKTYILGAYAEEDVTAKNFLKKGASGGVAVNDGNTGLISGVAETSVTSGNKVGVIKTGIVKLTAVTGTYNFGDLLGLNADGQTLEAAGTKTVLAVVAEPEPVVLASAGEIAVYLTMPSAVFAAT